MWPVNVSIALKQKQTGLIKLLPDWKNAEASGLFSENFFFDYFPDSLRNDARRIFSNAGKILSTGEMIPENQLRGYFMLYGQHADIKIRFTLSPENPPLIEEYRIEELPKKDSNFLKYHLRAIADPEEYEKIIAKNAGQCWETGLSHKRNY